MMEKAVSKESDSRADRVWFSRTQLEWLRRTFPFQAVVPGMGADQIMYNAGTAAVVAACEQREGVELRVR